MSDEIVDRREFLRRGGVLAGAAALGPALLRTGRAALGHSTALARPLLALPARECPIDTVVVLMMENRSFDHFLGWLGSDATYLENGRSRWGG